MASTGKDSLNTKRRLTAADGREYAYYSLDAAAETVGDVTRLPYTLKVLLENLLRHEDGTTVTAEDIQAVADWQKDRRSTREIAYRPARVLMQDFTGVPAVVDLAAMRAAMAKLGGDPEKINPLAQVDLVIDHSVMVDAFGNAQAFRHNVELEMKRNKERYEFLRWGQQAFDNFRVVPPGTGICHQVNLEYLGQTVLTKDVGGETLAFPDTLVGTDSHTTMINGLAVLGWGVGGIEAEAAMLGQPISMLIPEVVGFKLTGALSEGTTATDLVLTVTQMLREKGVVGKFVEFYGDALAAMSVADQATIANMAPEYGATCGFFPVSEATLTYLRFTGRDAATVARVEAYAKAQGLWADADTPHPVYSDTLELDLATVEPSLAGPKRPQDRVALSQAKASFGRELAQTFHKAGEESRRVPVGGENYDLGHGDVAIAAITSCTNTSNPDVMLAAGLVARNARAKGLRVKPWVKTSLAPGSQVVTDYLGRAGLQDDLDALGFNLVGYGCTTCIGNSGPLPEPISAAVNDNDLVVTSVLSGNRNFEGRVSPDVRANYLASPPLVVAYALAGSMAVDITTEPLGESDAGAPVYLKDIWPSMQEVHDCVAASITSEMFNERYGDVFTGDAVWQQIAVSAGQTYEWDASSTYVQHPPFFEDMGTEPAPIADIKAAHMLAMLGDSITTDHISPAGAIKPDSPAGRYLQEHGVERKDFNSYGSRRGNHEVMMRGTFANVRIRNEMAPGTEGGVTVHQPSGEPMAIYDAAMAYRDQGVPLVIVAGKEYGTGSSRDWAAKGTRLLGVKAVLAESYERIHRSNLVGMGVLPLQFKDGDGRASLSLTGAETFDITGIAGDIAPRQDVAVRITYADGRTKDITMLCRIDTADEVDYYRNGGILHYVLRRLAAD
ncbi:aconitate hydratase 1 [Rhodothalassium salexigens]|uniref:aconitate hydratase AcnA n=1 Tax=Rhodothalassium salexigens TaxID=1086 RepID=UPI0019134AE4|nr:aconitate hydratase AcnA [Rhodothalassium salexigens]MBK5910464.1 aconitate hydratase 1 [Rhodothalassium salexigens]